MQPNILLIVSDQHRLDCIGASNEYPVDTPHLDALAREGAFFTSAYTPIPLCTPARQSLLTGGRPESTGGLWNYDLGPRIPALHPEMAYSWPRELKSAGYVSQYIGKWHVSPDHGPVDFGYDSWVQLEDYDHWRAARYPDEPIATDWFGNIDPVPTADSRTHWLADRTADFIRSAATGDSPWHARLDLLEPHLPCQPTEKFAQRYPAECIPRWKDFDDQLIDKPYIQRQQLLNWGVEDYTWEDWAPVVARYYAIIAQMDDAIGSLLRALEESGAAENTLVIYTTDHGDMGGSRGMMDKHYVMYDSVVRVPFIARWPGRIAPQTTIDAFTYNTLDLAPTISEIVGIPGPEVAHGVPLFAASDDNTWAPSEAIRAREHIISTYNGQQFGLFIQRMIRDRDWKYIWNPTDVDELYDLNNDPNEITNRIDDADCIPTISDMRTKLYQQLLADGDSIVANHWMARQLTEGHKLGLRNLDEPARSRP